MWKPEDFVPSVETCIKLKELGFPQERGGWWWLKIGERWCLCLDDDRYSDVWDKAERVIKAPTVGELVLYLPENFEESYHDGRFWVWDDCGNGEHLGAGKTEAEARADLLITMAERKFKLRKRRRINEKERIL